ncbi:MAG: phytanoyl-CoA dioxygenase family protein [Planctomycetes bacterium]|nr:phytanoyl-CoA dioxygenase family protein [Planctomycetota bacterium]
MRGISIGNGDAENICGAKNALRNPGESATIFVMSQNAITRLDTDGYVELAAIFSVVEVECIADALTSALAQNRDGSTMRASDGGIYGARNLLQLWPGVASIWKRPHLQALLCEILGPSFGLVRVLFFDKPPENSWALPWHKDRAIAVRDHRLQSEHFSKPRFRAGVPHVEAPEWLLENMLTLRVHLDDVTEMNGPLKVLPRSHRGDESATPVTILGRRGDVLLMRPLLSHASNASEPGTTQHRRILHFEFSGIEQLPDGFEWHDFVR